MSILNDAPVNSKRKFFREDYGLFNSVEK